VGQREEYTNRADDISDHIRLLVAAGYDTTDDHTRKRYTLPGNDEALYRHFQDMTTRFSRLVLSTAVATAEYSSNDTQVKCLQEVDGVLNSGLCFAEIAKKQKGEDIPRLFPGFINQQTMGAQEMSQLKPSMDINQNVKYGIEVLDVPRISLTEGIYRKLHELHQPLSSRLTALEEQLVLHEKLVGKILHKQMADRLCETCIHVTNAYQPWMSIMQSIDASSLQFIQTKEATYTLIAELVIVCQAVAAPLADEWAARRDAPLDKRISYARSVAQETRNNFGLLMRFLHLTLDASARLAQGVRGPTQTFPDGGLTRPPTVPHTISHDLYNQEDGTSAASYFNVDSMKIKKFFGEIPLSGTTTSVADGTPAFLRLDHENEVQYDTKTNPPAVKGATITALVEQLTRHDRLNAPFNNTFLLTYQSFTTATELFEMLVNRWAIQPPPGLTQAEHDIWIERKQGPIRFRIVNVLKAWFDLYWMEGSDDATMALIQRVHRFAKDTVSSSGTPGAKQLLTVVDQRLRGEHPLARRLVPNNVEAPPPILPKSLKKFKLIDIDAAEFARQLTIMETAFYNKVKPQECLNKTWQKKVEESGISPAANVKALIVHSNRLTNWVAQMILMQQDLRKRVIVVKHFITIADRCLAICNFSTLTSIISALATAPIDRLSRTWAAINSKTTAILEKLRKLMGNTKNFGEYREALHQATPPCIPFFGMICVPDTKTTTDLLPGVYLTDLVFIEDGNPSTLKQTSLINFAKRAKTAEVIRQIQTYQNVPYVFKSVPELQSFIADSLRAAPDVHSLYERSLAVEPREREDEKIAR